VTVHEQLAALGAQPAPPSLVHSCGPNPGLACQLIWDLSHNARAASLTKDWFAGPVHLLLRVLFVVVLAVVIQAITHRVINRLTERAAQSLLPTLRGGMAASRLAARRGARRQRERGEAEAFAANVANVTRAPGEVGGGPGEEPAAAASQGEINAKAGQAERALVDERRKQRVRALGAILRSAASVTIFSIAGLVILGELGINLGPLLASAGVVGIAIGFGAQNLVRDYLSGIFMLVEDQYGVGDVISVAGATGTVEDVTLRITRLRDLNGIVWHVRNGAIDVVGNESQGWARAVIDFPVPYAANLASIRTLLENVAQAMWNEPAWRAVLLDAPEVWGAQEVTADQVTMRIVARTAPLRQWEVEREMRARVKAALDAAGSSGGAAAGGASTGGASTGGASAGGKAD
jgi:moderate conductance mechanosensitive channel